jgi:L-alanine-DL-glutamate epimerase-like enolase superfamily enzyme
MVHLRYISTTTTRAGGFAMARAIADVREVYAVFRRLSPHRISPAPNTVQELLEALS